MQPQPLTTTPIPPAANGESFWAGAAQGAASGAIAGAAVDVVVWTGGTGAIALVAVGAGGLIGSYAGDVVYSGITGTRFDIKRSSINAITARMLNMVSFGYSKYFFNRCDYNSFAEYIFTPNISDIPSTILTGNTGAIGAMASTTVNSVYNATKRAAASPTCSNRPYPHLRGGGGMVMMYA